MNILITGTAGHLGEALARTLQQQQHNVTGVDILPSAYTTHVGSITDAAFVRRQMAGIETVFHAATLHKPHVATHTPQQFIDTNITGTLNILEAALAVGVKRVIFTSTTSVFGDALVPPPGQPAAWITEAVTPVPKNIYGITKAAAEDLCQLFFKKHKLPCLVLRTSRFFAEADDNAAMRNTYTDDNIKVNEFLARRVELDDAVTAHVAAARHADNIGFSKYIISATTPFLPDDLAALRTDAATVLMKRVPAYSGVYADRDWTMFPELDRVYVNEKARRELGWQPQYDFQAILKRLDAGEDWRSSLAKRVGSKTYHPDRFTDGPYPV